MYIGMQDSWLVFFLKLLISAFKTIQASVYESPVTTDCVEFLWGREKGNVSPMLCIENIVKLCFWYWTKTCCHFYTLLRNRAASQSHLSPSSPPPRCLCISVCCLLSAVPCPFCTAVCFSVAAFVLCTNHDGFLQKETLSHGGPHRFPSCQALRRCKYPLVLPSPTFAAVLL